MRAAIIYYSYSGNTKRLADILTDYLSALGYEATVIRLAALDESGCFFTQATRALFHKQAIITSVEYNLSDYDLICLGTPVWALGPAPAMNKYLESCFGLEGKSLALFATYGSGTGLNRCLNYMQNILWKKGARDFKRISIQQFKLNNRGFIDKNIREQLVL